MEGRLRNRRRTVGLSIGLIVVVLTATLAVAGGMGAALPKDFRSWAHTKSLGIPGQRQPQ